MTLSNSAHQIWFKASPRGTRSGFAVLPDGLGGALTLTVLPKPWSKPGNVVHTRSHMPGETTHVVLHETEQLALTTTLAAAGCFARGLTEIAIEQADLIALGAQPKKPVEGAAVERDPFNSLLDLVLLAEHGSLANSPLHFEGAFAPSLLRILAYERLTNVVEGLIFRARPRYTERTETLSTPRGRLQEKSLLLSLASGIPQVTSTFDELTLDTPLLQIVASALKVVASDRLPHEVSDLRPGLQPRAVLLLRHLASVTPVERETALLKAERLWLGRLDQIWEPAVEAAIPVLREWSINPMDGESNTGALIVHIAMEKFWEQCLELALENAFSSLAVSRDARPGEGVNVPAPWTSQSQNDADPSTLASERFPDFLFRYGREIIVADAKYKLDVQKTPSSSDAYQLFAYSHLSELDDQPSNLAAILYPTRSGHPSRQIELVRLRGHDYSLWLAKLPFPTQFDLRSRGNWSAYIARLTSTLHEFSSEWIRRKGP